MMNRSRADVEAENVDLKRELEAIRDRLDDVLESDDESNDDEEDESQAGTEDDDDLDDDCLDDDGFDFTD